MSNTEGHLFCRLVDSFAKIYTPIVVLAALCMVTIPWAWGPTVGKFWAKNGLSHNCRCLADRAIQVVMGGYGYVAKLSS